MVESGWNEVLMAQATMAIEHPGGIRRDVDELVRLTVTGVVTDPDLAGSRRAVGRCNHKGSAYTKTEYESHGQHAKHSVRSEEWFHPSPHS